MAREISKNQRMNLVIETIKTLGTGTAGDVHARVAKRQGIDVQDSAFIRSIYRDLKQLADEGRLIADIYAPDGTKIDPEQAEKAKNIRIEYRLPDSPEEQIPGWKIVRDAGGKLVPPRRDLKWKASFLNNTSADGNFSLFFRSLNGRWVVIQLALAELPAKILFCREDESDPLTHNYGDLVAESFGLRTLTVVCADPSVSRGKESKRLGHAILTIDRDANIHLQDLGSKTGTYFAECPQELLVEVFKVPTSGMTMPAFTNPFELPVDWTTVEETDVTVPQSAILRLGSYRIAILKKTK